MNQHLGDATVGKQVCAKSDTAQLKLKLFNHDAEKGLNFVVLTDVQGQITSL